VEGLKLLSKSDPLIQCFTEETGQHILVGAGELHLQTCINDLSQTFANIELNQSDWSVTFKETVSSQSN